MSPTYDAIIVGAGMSGLAAGIRLAQFDQRVLVLERHYLWGGLNSFYKQAGRRFDVGLHALTNYAERGSRGRPLTRILRQLRLRWDDLALRPQGRSRIALGSCTLDFSNDFELLRQEVAERFPASRDAFDQLVAEIDALDAYAPIGAGAERGARAVLGERFPDPLLVEALLLPLCYYGSAREGDIDWYQFVILFRSIFQEGLGRPRGGIKPVLDLLVARFKEEGGELRLRTGVSELLHEDGRCRGVRLEDGEELLASRVLSSAGWGETMRLAGQETYERHVDPGELGRLSFMESIFVLDRQPRELGFDHTIVFFNDGESFDYRVPDDLIDTRSGVLASPNNYADSENDPTLDEGLYRLTNLAGYDAWKALGEEDYRDAKERCLGEALDAAVPFGIDPRPHAVHHDSFTPRTVERFTSKAGGCVYGANRKRLDGATPLEGLHLIGTDQGLLGITGALLSGITIANQSALVPNETP